MRCDRCHACQPNNGMPATGANLQAYITNIGPTGKLLILNIARSMSCETSSASPFHSYPSGMNGWMFWLSPGGSKSLQIPMARLSLHLLNRSRLSKVLLSEDFLQNAVRPLCRGEPMALLDKLSSPEHPFTQHPASPVAVLLA
eukprot:959242-Pelagomonas_calceolata.AAC.4